MGVSAARAAAFYREVLDGGRVWTVRDDDGIPAPVNSDGQPAMPFWSGRGRAERIITNVSAYRDFASMEIPLDEWRERWLPGCTRSGLLIGLNWSGTRATGYDVAAEQVEAALRESAPIPL